MKLLGKLTATTFVLVATTLLFGCGGGRSRGVKHQGYCAESANPIPQKIEKGFANEITNSPTDLPDGHYEFQSASIFYRLNKFDWIKDQYRQAGKAIPPPAALSKHAQDNKYSDLIIHLSETKFIHPKKKEAEKRLPGRVCFRGLRVDTKFISENVYGITDFDVITTEKVKKITNMKVKKYGFSFINNDFTENFTAGHETQFDSQDDVYKGVATSFYRNIPKERLLFERRIVQTSPRGAQLHLRLFYKLNQKK